MQIIEFIKQDLQTLWQKYWGLTLMLALLFAVGSAYSFPVKMAQSSGYVSTQGTLSRTCKLTVFSPQLMTTLDVRDAIEIRFTEGKGNRTLFVFIHGKEHYTTRLAVSNDRSHDLTQKLVKCIQQEGKKGDVLPSEFSTLIDQS